MKYKFLLISIIIYVILFNYLWGYNFKSDLENFLDENISSDFTIEYISPEKDFYFDESNKNIRMAFEIPNGCNLRGTTFINVKFIENNILINSKNISLKIRLYNDVVVANKTINRNSSVEYDYLNKVKKDITNLTNYYTSFEELLGKIAVNRIKKGSIIRTTSIRNPYDVKINDKISILAESGNVRVETKVTAKQNGYIGDVIKVYNPDFRKTLKAKLLSSKICIVIN
ncbi:MAG: flagellar basal body P-ring formation protein FlgA [Candidatus Cloacimonetes bacterium]|nr:flagellar basal body P-ring formation protein FlgA [Candidatus Cloacimonadota bacterium]